MHIAIVLIKLGGVRLRGESGETLLEDVDAQGLVRRDYHIDAQIKLVTVNQQRICDVSRDHRRFIDIELVKAFNNMDATTLGRVRRLNDPNVTLWLSLAKFCVVGMEVMELVW